MLFEFSRAHEDLRKIRSWMEMYEVRTDASRFARYEKTLKLLSDFSDEVVGSEKDNEFRETLHEYFELAYIYEAFKSSSPAGLGGLLKKIVSGSASVSSENPQKSAARDFAFEASVGARIGISGIIICFCTSGDVYFEFEGLPIYVQCKRLGSESQSGKRIAHALSQLEIDWKLYNESHVSRPYGIIAVDITKLINPKLESQLVIDPTTDKNIMNGIVDDYIKSNLQEYIFSAALKSENRLLGVLVKYSSISYLQKAKMYNCVQSYTLIDAATKGSVGKAAMDNLCAYLNIYSNPRSLILDFSKTRKDEKEHQA